MLRVYQQFTKGFTINLKSLLIFMCKLYCMKLVNFLSYPLQIQGKKVYLGCKQTEEFTWGVNNLFTRSLLRSLHIAIN